MLLQDPLISGATLIVTPTAIRHQWREEITKQIGAAGIKVYVCNCCHLIMFGTVVLMLMPLPQFHRNMKDWKRMAIYSHHRLPVWISSSQLMKSWSKNSEPHMYLIATAMRVDAFVNQRGLWRCPLHWQQFNGGVFVWMKLRWLSQWVHRLQKWLSNCQLSIGGV